MYLPQLEDMWSYVHRNTLEVFCIRGAQIDKYGNVNNGVIREFQKPKVRLPGSAGMGDMCTLDKHILIWSTAHNAQTSLRKSIFWPRPATSTASV